MKTPPVENADPAGASLTVRELKSGADTTFGNVTNFAWQDKGTHLAMTIGVEGREGNAVQLFDPSRGELKVLDSGNAVFTALAWRKDSADLAALRSVKNKDYEGESYTRAGVEGPGQRRRPAKRRPRSASWHRARRSGARMGARSIIGIADWDRKVDARKARRNLRTWRSGIRAIRT